MHSRLPYLPLLTGITCLPLSYAVTDSYYGQYADDCPALCSDAGINVANWTHMHRMRELSSCNQTVVFDLNVQTLVDDPANVLIIRGCTMTNGQTFSASDMAARDDGASVESADQASSSACAGTTTHESLQPGLNGRSDHGGTGATPHPDHVQSAAGQLASFLETNWHCNSSIMFAKHASAVVGVFVGASISQDSALGLVKSFKDAYPGYQAASLQVCDGKDAAKTFGIYATGFPDLSVSQDAVRAWTNGQCVNGSTPAASTDITFLASSIHNSTAVAGNLTSTNLFRALSRRGSFGPDPDGTCHVHSVGAGDSCWFIADKYGISQDDLFAFNKKTWGWAGCQPLQLGKVCVSRGVPPMPAPVADTQCGPQVPGTKKPTNGTAFADLNPCPLNACCDVWGFCGTTPEFCTKSPAGTGNPGTTQPGKASCISNCGMEMVNNGEGPKSFQRLGYYEAFNGKRSCLKMNVNQIDTSKYTSLHFAFAGVTAAWDVDLADLTGEFEDFVKLKGPKRVLSFGGWAFSTEAATFQRFRQATNPANRGTFVNNLVSFMSKHDIDGLDFDWEYPGAPDIPDIPPGGPEEGNNYLGFLILLRSRLPVKKSISIALPASFWYLKQYPVKDIARYVDYFIYMTYDLHGQWDVGNKWAIPSCEGGNCLRSHVNKTETINSLVMLTKAGVHSNQILVGVSSYGRSFRVQDDNCFGPMCTFRGGRSDSQAYPGRCTATGGYISNAEIQEILNSGNSGYSILKQYVDDESDSTIAIYGNPGAVDWVAYMIGPVKDKRIDWIKQQNFGGFSDWAIDLADFESDEGDNGDDPILDGDDAYLDSFTCDGSYGDLQSIADNIDKMPVSCAVSHTVETLSGMISDSLDLFGKYDEGYDKRFGWYVDWVKEGVDPKLDDFTNFRHGAGMKFFDCSWEMGRKKGSGACEGMEQIWDEYEGSFTITYKLKDEAGFNKSLSEDLGIDPEWVVFGNRDKDYACQDLTNEVWQGRPGKGGMSECRKMYQRRHNVPKKGPDSKIHVANPKELINNIMPNITTLKASIDQTFDELNFGIYDDTPEQTDIMDAVNGYALPVLQLSESVDSMKTIKEIGENANAEKKRNLIMSIITYILMALPFVGQAVGEVFGAAVAIARITILIAEAGNAAMTIADIVKDPGSAPFAMIGFIVGSAGVGGGGGKGLTRPEGLNKAAQARRLLKDSDFKLYTDSFKAKDALVQKIASKRSCAIKS